MGSILNGTGVTFSDGTTQDTSGAGMVAFFAMDTAPAGWLKANGAAVSRTTYAKLFAAIGTTYGSGDGSTTFNIPDMRGYFPRALSDGVSLDSGRAIGSKQTGQSVIPQDTGYTVYSSMGYLGGALATPTAGAEGHATAGIIYGSDRSYTGGDTRPYNIALLACIKC